MGLFDLFKRSRKSPAGSLAKPVMRELPAPTALPEPVGTADAAAEPPVEVLTPVELRILLFDAIATGDEEKLARLCRDHHDFLVEYADTWSIVPDALHANPEAARWYSEGFRAIAHFCSERLGRRELLARLHEAERPDTRAPGDGVDAYAA
jgi:hypothetical protein